MNIKAWDALPAEYKAALESACGEANDRLLADYDTRNPAALQRLVNQGTVLRAYPRDVMQAAFEASKQIYAEEAAKNPAFKKIFVNWEPYRTEAYRWFRVGEGTMDNFMFSGAVGTAGSQGRSGQGCSGEGVALALRLPVRGPLRAGLFVLAFLRPIPGGRVVGRRGLFLARIRRRVGVRLDEVASVTLQIRGRLVEPRRDELRPDDHDRRHDQLQHDPRHRAPVDVRNS